MQDFRNLKVWQRAHRLTLDVYRTTEKFPVQEQYGLTSQMRRSAASIATNLAEGCGRYGDAELVRFAQISMGSASELEYQLILARDLGYLTDEDFEPVRQEIIEVKRMLGALITRLRAGSKTRINGQTGRLPGEQAERL
jgi:four helix bundle protein